MHVHGNDKLTFTKWKTKEDKGKDTNCAVDPVEVDAKFSPPKEMLKSPLEMDAILETRMHGNDQLTSMKGKAKEDKGKDINCTVDPEEFEANISPPM